MDSIRTYLSDSFRETSAFCGYGIILAAWKWSEIALRDSYSGDILSVVFNACFATGLLVSAALCFLTLRTRRFLLDDRKTLHAIYACLFISFFLASLVHVGPGRHSIAICAASGCLLGFSVGGSVLIWIEQLGNSTVSKAVAEMAVAYISCLIIYFYLLNMTSAFAIISVLASPIISLLILKRHRKNASLPQKQDALPLSLATFNSISIYIWIVIVNVAYRFSQDYGTQSFELMSLSQIGSLVPVVLIVALLTGKPGKTGFRSLYTLSLALLAAGLLIPASSTTLSVAGGILVGSSYFVVSIAMGVLAAAGGSLSKTSAAKNYLYVIIANAISMYISGLLPYFDLTNDTGLNPSTSIVLLVALLVVCTPYALRKDSVLQFYFDMVGTQLTTNRAEVDDVEICNIVAERYALTKREMSILLLHLKGHSQTQIAEELFIAEGTVRAHYGNIYSKLNVHSKSELNALLQAIKDELVE